jgi:hypothetical protein
MSMAEIAFEFRHAASILIASQGFLPASGLSYRNALFDLVNDPNITPKDWAAGIVNGMFLHKAFMR